MTNCEETECINIRTAICLHCHLHLCVTHIVAHGKLLSKESNQLCEQMNDLIEQLNVRLQQIHRAREKATNELNTWRQNQIDEVEQRYDRKIQMIEFRKDHLIDLENQFTQRLVDEAIRPLEFMQTRQSGNSESLKRIHQAIVNIAYDSAQLDSSLNESINQVSSSQQHAGIKTQNSINSSISGSDSQSSINSQPPVSQPAPTTVPKSTTESTASTSKTPKVTPKTKASTQPKVTPQAKATTIPKVTPKTKASTQPKVTPQAKASTIPKPKSTATASALTTSSKAQSASSTTSTASALPPTPKAQSASSTTSTATASALPPPPPKAQSVSSATLKAKTKRPLPNSSRPLTKFFEDTSGNSDYNVEQYIIQYLHQVVHENNLMILMLSLLTAWHSPKSPTEIHHSVLIHHINIVKKYIKKSKQQLTVIAASQQFLTSCQYDERKSSELMTSLLQFFFKEQCITKETILDWYNNGDQYGYVGFEKAKLSAQSFIDQLNTLTGSK